MISQSKRASDDDPFEDLPSPPHHKPNPPPRKAKPLPVIIEGAFGNRTQKKTKKVSMESFTEGSTDDEETAAHWAPSPRPPTTKESDDTVEAEATWPPLRGKKSNSEGVNGIQTEGDLEHQAAEQRRREKGKQKAEEPDESVVIKPRMEIFVNGHYQSTPLPLEPPQLLTPNAQGTPGAGPSRVMNGASTRLRISVSVITVSGIFISSTASNRRFCPSGTTPRNHGSEKP